MQRSRLISDDRAAALDSVSLLNCDILDDRLAWRAFRSHILSRKHSRPAWQW